MKQIYKKGRLVLTAVLLGFSLVACDASVSLHSQSISSSLIRS